MSEDIQNCCRICLVVGSEHTPIQQDSSVHLHIKSCLSMTVSADDELPRIICRACVSQLAEFYHFQLNARCSQDWLESCLLEKERKAAEVKMTVQPLPDSEYNSDSLLEFLNNTANIDEYLSSLGKEDIPAIVNMLDKNEASITGKNCRSPKKRGKTQPETEMEIDVLDSDIEIVNEILLKETAPKLKSPVKGESCFACKTKHDNIKKLAQHLNTCEKAARYCKNCGKVFDSRPKMLHHSIGHITEYPATCKCGKTFSTNDTLLQHYKEYIDCTVAQSFVFKCKQCDVTFNDRLEMYKHAKRHLLKSEEKFCDICGQYFIGDEPLLAHRKKKHGKADDVLFRCKICSHTSKDRGELYLHVVAHTEQRTPVYPCASCGRSFTNKTLLLKHLNSHKENVKNIPEAAPGHNIICEHCGDSLDTKTFDFHKCK